MEIIMKTIEIIRKNPINRRKKGTYGLTDRPFPPPSIIPPSPTLIPPKSSSSLPPSDSELRVSSVELFFGTCRGLLRFGADEPPPGGDVLNLEAEPLALA